ncbi:YhgE/Pip domain-containing protein [Limosilactobacillus coleohominis]|uniref:YhgE/Pip domain-containing protein n=1 Tax=Limosilactobacillus coleohominis TaxID=181675 RepID=UPI002A919B3F|nr:YhgE/Pip domain-containing protein [Limosilactobacillus coleohominis]MDY5628278.1 YhgE/Pip domain-containing protein [Limosilactobacillus coleohominis]
MWEMIKAEFRHIRRNHLLLLSSIVICFIPFLYSIFFLKSVWDPYGSTQNLPVAVVNKDVPVDYQGKRMAVGDQMVKELKHNHQLDWKFVSESQGKYGMSHRKYYTVVTIPENFSKNATTVLDKHPETMKLKYSTNDSLNYIGYVMSQVAMTRLNERIRANVTNAYATALFKELKVLGKGMNQAASGATQLDNGLVTLQSGVNQYVAGVSQVNNGVQTLRMSVAPLASGAQQLASGSATLANGIARYTGGVGQLAAGLGTLQANSGALNSGAGQLSAGLNTLRGNSGALRSGAGQLAAGTNELNNTVNSALGNLPVNEIMGVMNQAQTLQKSMGTLTNGLQKAEKALNDVQTQAQVLQGASGSIAKVSQAGKALEGIGTNDGTIAALATKIQSDSGASDETKQAAAAIVTKANSNVQTVQGVGESLKSISSLSSSLSGMQTQLNKLSDMQGTLDNAQNTINQANTLLSNLNGYKDQLTKMPGALNELKGATNKISAGASSLNAGVNQYTNGVDTAAAGSNTLASGIGQYTAGVAQAGAGASQLTANSGALNSGAGQLAGALGQLNAQVPALVGGVNQLANGTQQLVNNSPALVQGITRLNQGAGQLASALGKGAKTVNGIKPTKRTAKMIAEPTEVKHKSYSYVPNYGHALAPYVLSVALYVGALIFNFVYPIRRVAIQGRSPLAWWASKVVLGSLMITLMAIAEGGIMMALGLTVIHVPSFFGTLILFGLASMAVVMFLSMTFDNPGRFVAMVLLMLQLGGSGGTFPMEVTMKFYNVIHYALPMTYSILGLRNGISGGLGTHYVAFCNSVLAGIAVVFFLLLLVAMYWLQHHHFAGKSELDNNQELLGEEKDDDGMHLQDRDQTV